MVSNSNYGYINFLQFFCCKMIVFVTAAFLHKRNNKSFIAYKH